VLTDAVRLNGDTSSLLSSACAGTANGTMLSQLEPLYTGVGAAAMSKSGKDAEQVLEQDLIKGT